MQPAEPAAAAAAGHGPELESLRRKVLSLEVRLQDELLPQLEEAANASSQHKERLESLHGALTALANGRLAAAEEVRRLTKQQLAEIKHLAKDPPGILRRLLLMLWLILHGERFRGSKAVQVDEFRDWPRCQRMLADEGFVSHILNFDPSSLEHLPKVTAFIESCFRLIGIADQAASPEPPSQCASPEPADIVRPETAPLDKEEGKPVVTPVAKVMAPRLPSGAPPAKRRPSLTPGSPSNRSVPSSPASIKRVFANAPRTCRTARLPPLSGVQAVARASAPCGVLIRWMRELMLEYRKRRHVLEDMSAVEEQLVEAQERRSCAEKFAASVEADLARTKFSLAVWEAEQLRSEELSREHERRQLELGQLRKTVRNERLEEAIKKSGFNLEAEIVSYQVRHCKKLGQVETRNSQSPLGW